VPSSTGVAFAGGSGAACAETDARATKPASVAIVRISASTGDKWPECARQTIYTTLAGASLSRQRSGGAVGAMSGRWRSLQAIRCRPSRLNYRVTAFSHNVRMSERYPLALRQADQARTDFATIESDLQFLMGQLARVPTRKEQARNALGIIFATAMLTTVAVLLFTGFWRYCL
jgi:hypothetical protein